jgi:nicotinamide-nucleotide amidase
MTGGLGPTDGDLTRAALSCVLGDEMVVDDRAVARLKATLAKRGREVSERQLRQTQRPVSAKCIDNDFGTAPGLHAVVSKAKVLDVSARGEAKIRAGHSETDVICLPGPPSELKPMFERSVRAMIRVEPSRAVMTRLLHIVGVPEAECVERLGGLTKRERMPLVGITASGGILTLRIRFEGTGERGAIEREIDEVEASVRRELGVHVLPGRGEASRTGAQALCACVVEELARRGLKLATVESCTGGMLGEMVTQVSGSSAAYVGGFVTYANEMKESIGVEYTALDAHGAVSEQVASQMALRGLERTGADVCIATTGVAGPSGGSDAKPVGTVWVAVALRASGGRVDARRFLIPGGRDEVRTRACVSGLAMVHFALSTAGEGVGPRLLWQV